VTARAERECFVCDADKPREMEQPWEWAAPRLLCRRHERDVRLADGHRRAQVGRPWPDSLGELQDWLSLSGLAEPDVRPVRGRSFFVALAALAQRRFPSILAAGGGPP
jgi:hypothetical protein